jgi:enoyl-[acyl-carrier protein] reductase/trans-2-enoyl-CoA reductase (NAD+)
MRERTIAELREHFGGRCTASCGRSRPRERSTRGPASRSRACSSRSVAGLDPHLHRPRRGPRGRPRVAEFTLPPGNPEEAVATQYVMGGRIVEQWIDALLAADLLAPGFTLVTISYRGNPLNARLSRRTHRPRQGRPRVPHPGPARAVSGPRRRPRRRGRGPRGRHRGLRRHPRRPALHGPVTRRHGRRFEDPLASMLRMFRTKLPLGGCSDMVVDEHGLVRMDDLELTAEVQTSCSAASSAAARRPLRWRVLPALHGRVRADPRLWPAGVDYEAEFDTDAVCLA